MSSSNTNGSSAVSTGVSSPLTAPTTPGSASTTAATAVSQLLHLSPPAAKDASSLPLNIGHRGFRARYPENSIEGHQKAIDVGHAVALETDIHLTKDKVVVLSHDPTLKRCFGRPEKIADIEWSFIKDLRTTREPHVPMARLDELLEFLSAPGREHNWMLLDIKIDDDPKELVTRVAETIKSVPGDWSKRIVLGCWQAQHMRHCEDLLPGYGISFIGFSLPFANELLRYESVQYFNMAQGVLVGPLGDRFIRKAKSLGKYIFVWTVNAPEWMEWSISKGLDGVITDDPVLFGEIQKKWSGGGGDDGDSETKPLASAKRPASITAVGPSFTGLHIRRWARLYGWVAFVNTLAYLFTGLARLRWGPSAKRVDAALKR